LGVFGPNQPGAVQLQVHNDVAPVKSPGAGIKTADDLLLALENADAHIRSLEGDIRYDKLFEIVGDRQIRTGKLWFVDEKNTGGGVSGGRKFAIRFDQLQVGKRVQPEEKIMSFDGEWLVEKLPANKEMIKRRVVAPGEKFDPLKIGEGPFPLPIGQKRVDILDRFDAQLLAPDADLQPNEPSELEAMAAFIKGSHQLKLTPKANAKSDFTEVRLWYRPEGTDGKLLPRMARTINQQGDVSIVWLDKVRTNQPVPEGVLDVTAPPGWNVHIDDFQAKNGR
jgi:hypothetical protein